LRGVIEAFRIYSIAHGGERPREFIDPRSDQRPDELSALKCNVDSVLIRNESESDRVDCQWLADRSRIQRDDSLLADLKNGSVTASRSDLHALTPNASMMIQTLAIDVIQCRLTLVACVVVFASWFSLRLFFLKQVET
jgi:hypothetical protein